MLAAILAITSYSGVSENSILKFYLSITYNYVHNFHDLLNGSYPKHVKSIEIGDKFSFRYEKT